MTGLGGISARPIRQFLRPRVLESMPGVGSAVMEPSLRKRFGVGCLKIPAMGHDVLYERHDEDDAAVILGVVNQKRVR